MIQPVKHKNTVEITIDNIGSFIINHLRVGDVLPGEREIAEKLQISRNITREALQHYRTLGIIESKPKVGAVVARLTPQKAFDGYLPFISIMEHGMKDLAQLRLMLELGAAEATIDNITAEDISSLREKCQRMEDIYLRGKHSEMPHYREELCNLDLEFHSCLLNLSRNKLVESLVPLVVEFFSKQLIEISAHSDDNVSVNGYLEHFELVSALEKHDLPAMQKLIRTHIGYYIQKLEQANTSFL